MLGSLGEQFIAPTLDGNAVLSVMWAELLNITGEGAFWLTLTGTVGPFTEAPYIPRKNLSCSLCLGNLLFSRRCFMVHFAWSSIRI